jgi:glutaredoxin-related protein
MFIKKIEKKNYGCNKVLIKKFYSEENKDIMIHIPGQVLICNKCDCLYTCNTRSNFYIKSGYIMGSNQLLFGGKKCDDCNNRILYYKQNIHYFDYIKIYENKLFVFKNIKVIKDYKLFFSEVKKNGSERFFEDIKQLYLYIDEGNLFKFYMYLTYIKDKNDKLIFIFVEGNLSNDKFSFAVN